MFVVFKCSNVNFKCHTVYSFNLDLDDQTQEDSKPAGQPGQASLNQCQACLKHGLSQQGVWVSFYDTQTLKMHPSGHQNLFMRNF